MYIRMRRDASLQREAILNAKTYSRRDERRILDVLGRGLLKEFPNPERVGCPDADVLTKIASHQMPLSEAETWLDHLGSCSPCYADFKRLQEAHKQRLLAAVAGIVLAVAVTGWAALHKWSENVSAQTAVLDLRDRSIARGAEPNPAEPPLEISRKVSHVKIYLPFGSIEGDYDIRISGPEGKILFAATGVASRQQGITTVSVDMRLSATKPGIYVLQLQRAGSGGTSYPLLVK